MSDLVILMTVVAAVTLILATWIENTEDRVENLEKRLDEMEDKNNSNNPD